jgi:hypothetical protein
MLFVIEPDDNDEGDGSEREHVEIDRSISALDQKVRSGFWTNPMRKQNG